MPLPSIIVDYAQINNPSSGVITQLLHNGTYPEIMFSSTPPIGADANNCPYAILDSTVSGAKPIMSNNNNRYDGDLFSYTYPGAATLIDGTQLDVIITYSNMNIVVQDNLNVAYRCRSCIAMGSVLRTGNDLNNTTNHRYGLQIDVKMQVVYHDTQTPVMGTVIYAVTDIDVMRSATNFGRLNGSDGNTAEKNSYYSEQIQINDTIGHGLASPIYIPDHDGVSEPDTVAVEDRGYKCVIQDNNESGIDFIANGKKDDDPGTYYSGFVTLINNSTGLQLTVRSSGGNIAGKTPVIVRTSLLSATDYPPLLHRIVSVTGDGGNITVPITDGTSGAFVPEGETIMGPGTLLVMDGRTVTYTMTPDAGSRILSVRIGDGTTDAHIKGNFSQTELLGMAVGGTRQVPLAVDRTGVLKREANGVFTFTFPDNNEDHYIEVKWDNAPGTASIHAVKHISGREWHAGDTFTFELTAVDGGPLRTVDGQNHTSLRASVDWQTFGHEVIFPALKFVPGDLGNEQEKSFTYRIREVVPQDTKGLTYDTTPQERIVHVQNDNGTLKITYGEERKNHIVAPNFYNHYSCSGSVQATLYAKKQLLDKNGEVTSWDDKVFTLVLDAAGASDPLPDSTQVQVTANQPEAAFGPITFTAPGVYHYTIHEELPSGVVPLHPADNHYLYDPAYHAITVYVGDDGNGNLTGPEVYYEMPEDSEGQDFPTLVNHELQNAYAVLEVKKVLEGDHLIEGEFTFILSELNDDGEVLHEVERATDGADGAVYFSPLVFNHNDLFSSGTAGDESMEKYYTKYYTVMEREHINGTVYEEGDIIFDTEQVLFKVTIHHSAEHQLNVTRIEYKKGSGLWQVFGNGSMPVFRNISKESRTIDLSASKRLSGKEWDDSDAYTFRVTALDGGPMNNGKSYLEATADKDHWIVYFDEITVKPMDLYDASSGTWAKSKTFRYKIHEYVSDGHGDDRNDGSGFSMIVKDGRVILLPADVTVSVHVSEEEDGRLYVTYGDQYENLLTRPQFLNTFEGDDIPTPAPIPTAVPTSMPKTGDTANPALWIAMILLGLGACTCAVLLPRKKGKSK